MQAKAILALIVCGELVLPFSAWAQTQNRVELRPPSAFATIPDIAARSRALFTEAAKVFMHPRCTNCHPATDRPLQGNDQHLHQPAAQRGPDGTGVAGNHCTACHTGSQLRSARRRFLPEHSGTPALAIGADRNGVGRQAHR
jgi:hypothetical protein